MPKLSSCTCRLLIFLTLLFLPNAFAQGVLLEPSVRLVYFLPNDRPARPDRVAALRQLIKDTQQFYAEQMELHGFGRKTFNVETDANGEPVVHRINGRFNEHHYYTGTSDHKIWEELYAHFRDPKHIYFLAIDVSHETLNDGTSCGLGSVSFLPSGEIRSGFVFRSPAGRVGMRHRGDVTQGEEVIGGSAIIPASGHCFEDNRGVLHRLRATTHELGHAFGLGHNFRDPDAVVGGRGYRLSKCAAEWLSVHRFFNPNPIGTNQRGSVKFLGLEASGHSEIHLRFEVSDPDGLHQAQLLVAEDAKLINCQALDGQTHTVECTTTELTALSAERVIFQFMDARGNITWATFLIDTTAVLPPPKVVSIPDPNLAADVRKALGLGRNAPITQYTMQGLTELRTGESQTRNLTGLEHATRLVRLSLWDNQIQDLSPIAGLTQLRQLHLQSNQITDITPLAKLTQLTHLHLWGNRIRDIRPLKGLTRLESLWLSGNQIRDVSSLAGLINLTDLTINGNPIQDTSPFRTLLERNPNVELDIEIAPSPNPNLDLDIDLNAGPKIEGPWVWTIAPTGRNSGATAARSGKDWLAAASGGSVTERHIATNGAIPGAAVGNRVWTSGKLAPTGSNNIAEMVNAIGLGDGNYIEYHVAYGALSLDSPQQQNTKMYVGSDDAVKVWLNGVLVHNNPVNRGARDYQETFSVTLKQGRNILLVAVYNGLEHWTGFFGFENDTVYTLAPPSVAQEPVPATGTWLAIHRPQALTRGTFTIGPEEFAIFVHNRHQTATQKGDFNTYSSYYPIGKNAKAPDIPDLAHFFRNGGRIELISHATLNPLPPGTHEPEFGDIVISEILWGLDGTSPAKQYIELYNASAHTYTFTNGDLHFRFSQASEAPLPDRVYPLPANPNAENKVIDRVSNKGWKVPGRSGNTSQDQPLISMYRTINYATGRVPDGTLANSWKGSTGRINLSPPSYGTPGAKHLPPAPVVLVGDGNWPPMYWIDTKTGTLRRLIGDKVETLASNVKNVTGLAVDAADGKLYWAEKTGEHMGRIQRAHLNGTHLQLVKNLTSAPQGIALDDANGKIYLTNAWGKVQRLNVDGSNFQPNLITGLDAPKSLTLDVSSGKVYWTDGSGRIQRANLDGSKVETVVTGLATPMDIAVFGNTLYWAEKTGENRGEIRYVNLNGNRSAGIHTTLRQGFPVGIAVDAAARMLYWTTSLGNIGRSSLDRTTPQENVVTGLDAPTLIAVQARAPERLIPEILTSNALLRIAPSPVTSPAVGEQLTVNLNITAGEAVAGYQVTVGFDATALRYVESGNGAYLPTGAFFVPPVVDRGHVELAATALTGVSNGDGTLATITFEVMEVKASTLTVSEPLLADNQANTSRPRVEGGEITEPPELTADVNGDGTVNIQDLVLVASSFGQMGQTAADVNGDGVVNIADLVLVAGGLNTGAGAPPLVPGALEMLTAADVQAWLSQAHQLDSRYADYPRGISVLEHLLAALTPQATALLPNYPNPFNPETWIPYQLAQDSDVKISIYDARGSVVRVLTLGHQSAGYYTSRSRAAYWDGRNTFGERVASSVYVYQLQAGNISSLRKMTLLK